jgi:hypothetical protein
MKNVVEVYHEKVAQLQQLMRELEALRLVAPLLAEEADLTEAFTLDAAREKKEKQKEPKIALP